MLKFFLALWLACAGPAHHNSGNNKDQHTIVKADSDPGDNGHVPPPPPPPGS